MGATRSRAAEPWSKGTKRQCLRRAVSWASQTKLVKSWSLVTWVGVTGSMHEATRQGMGLLQQYLSCCGTARPGLGVAAAVHQFRGMPQASHRPPARLSRSCTEDRRRTCLIGALGHLEQVVTLVAKHPSRLLGQYEEARRKRSNILLPWTFAPSMPNFSMSGYGTCNVHRQ